MWLRALAVGLALVLAGCTGFTTGGAEEAVTPAPVPTDGLQYPPGVTEDGVVPAALARAHAGSLETTSYTLTTRQTLRDRDGDLVRRVTHVRRVRPGAVRYAGRFRQNVSQYRAGFATSAVTYWANESTVATRYRNERGEVTLLRWAAGGERFRDLSDRTRLEGELAAMDLTVVDRTDRGGVVLAGARLADRDELVTPLFVHDVTNVSVRMRVAYDGTAVARRVEYDAAFRGERVHVVRTARVTGLGATTVERPDWVANTTESERV
ncbi:DUF7537 family lipoprotein [Haloarcula litorea]|uniref:DUF7537 family lipoprotein n=1 Tax=Haloarcula litorea TaxID=3032579 RepID=UPI0023E8356E|nr:hypothetical protein [Halomicroarcula sp. GDY20]